MTVLNLMTIFIELVAKIGCLGCHVLRLGICSALFF